VRGSDQASVAAERIPSPTPRRDAIEARGSRLAGRPGHRTPAEEVQVEMIHALTTVFARIDDSPVAGFGDLFLTRDCCRE